MWIPNEFGHWICHCKSEKYHLFDTSLIENLDHQCFEMGEQGPCHKNYTLDFVHNNTTDDLLVCTSDYSLSTHSILVGGLNIRTNKCTAGGAYIFGRCREVSVKKLFSLSLVL